MERESRKVKEKEYAGNSKEQVCLSNAKGGMENTYMRSKYQSLPEGFKTAATSCVFNNQREE